MPSYSPNLSLPRPGLLDLWVCIHLQGCSRTIEKDPKREGFEIGEGSMLKGKGHNTAWNGIGT